MSRPGFVLEVDERTPALLMHQGEGFRLEKLPLGSRVIYPPESLPGIRDVDEAIRQALANPVGRPPGEGAGGRACRSPRGTPAPALGGGRGRPGGPGPPGAPPRRWPSCSTP